MYPEGILFPSIHWKMAIDNCSIVGAIPAPLLIESVLQFGFASIKQHIRARLTSSTSSTSSDAANHEDTRLILNRGLAVCDDAKGGLGLRGKNDSALLESVDNRQMVKNLCFSQKYHPWDHFVTYTCNQRDHFGTAPINRWTDSGEWKKHCPGYDELEVDDQKEIEQAVK